MERNLNRTKVSSTIWDSYLWN